MISMVQSMTGYGKGVAENDKLVISVELKSLNSKFADINIKLPKEFSSRELEIRAFLQSKLARGKISFTCDIDYKGNQNTASINQELLQSYYDMLSNAASSVGNPQENVFKTALNMPEVMSSSSANDTDDTDWKCMQQALQKASDKLQEFRKTEGNTLKVALEGYISQIDEGLQSIVEIDPKRKEMVKEKIRTQLLQLKEVNSDRLEQELIYYYEKLDITEEIVRLGSHLKYFNDELPVENNGKKLGFISQEIGREINTIGSKANNADIQRLVVCMKDELEKIKEQSLNIL